MSVEQQLNMQHHTRASAKTNADESPERSTTPTRQTPEHILKVNKHTQDIPMSLSRKQIAHHDHTRTNPKTNPMEQQVHFVPVSCDVMHRMFPQHVEARHVLEEA